MSKQQSLGLKRADVIDRMNKTKPVTSQVEVDEITQKVTKSFDYEFDGKNEFEPYEKPNVPEEFNIGLIVGPSGSGKSLLLDKFGEEKEINWNNNKSLISHFESYNKAIQKFTAVGLNSVPTWAKPFKVLSGGEKFRANLARKLENGMVVDEFTSVVNRDVAKAVSTALSRYVNKNNIHNIVLASPHEDIIRWLEPDWVASTYDGVVYDGDHLRRPEIKLDIHKTSHKVWPLFKDHHYLDKSINKASRCYLGKWNGKVIAFSAVMRLPNPYIENAWRGHRTVVLPDYQGIGIGTNFLEAVGDIFIENGKRFYARTAHPRVGKHREKSDKWKATSKNQVKRTDIKDDGENFNDWERDNERVCYSHEYVG